MDLNKKNNLTAVALAAIAGSIYLAAVANAMKIDVAALLKTFWQ